MIHGKCSHISADDPESSNACRESLIVNSAGGLVFCGLVIVTIGENDRSHCIGIFGIIHKVCRQGSASAIAPRVAIFERKISAVFGKADEFQRAVTCE